MTATLETDQRARQEIKELETGNQVLVVGHTYQPPRTFAEVATGKRANIGSQYNDLIRDTSYAPVFETPVLPGCENLPQGFAFSLYGTLRDWWKEKHPEGWEKAKERILTLPDKEYMVLGDSYVHPILPHLPERMQDVVVKIGREAFREDFGFDPKGLWLPEAAVNSTTLKVAFKNGYEFVVLQDQQLEKHDHNPMYVPILENGQVIGHIGVIHVDEKISGKVSHGENDTDNADDFLEKHKNNGNVIAWGSDTERYGWHGKGKDQFLYTVLRPDVLKSKKLRPFNVKQALKTIPNDDNTTNVKENSSWSCQHELARWRGGCPCNKESKQHQTYKSDLRTTLNETGAYIDDHLDFLMPSWENVFIPFFLSVRKEMYVSGDLDGAINAFAQRPGMEAVQNPEIKLFFKAQLARLTAETSCVWFFSGKDRPERAIADINIKQIQLLIDEYPRLLQRRSDGVVFVVQTPASRKEVK